MKNVAEKFANYNAFKYHFEPVTILETGHDDYMVFYGGVEPENQIQRGTKEYINGWLYGAVQTVCGQIRKAAPDSGDQKGICPACDGEIEYNDNEQGDGGGVYPWTCPDCGATGEEGYDEVFDGNHYNVRDSDGNPIPGRLE